MVNLHADVRPVAPAPPGLPTAGRDLAARAPVYHDPEGGRSTLFAAQGQPAAPAPAPAPAPTPAPGQGFQAPAPSPPAGVPGTLFGFPVGGGGAPTVPAEGRGGLPDATRAANAGVPVPSDSRPPGLPDQFQSVGQLATSYDHMRGLYSRLAEYVGPQGMAAFRAHAGVPTPQPQAPAPAGVPGQQQQPPAPAPVPPTPPAPAPSAPAQQQQHPPAPAAGDVFAPYAQEFASTGTLSPGSIQVISQTHGIPEHFVQAYVAMAQQAAPPVAAPATPTVPAGVPGQPEPPAAGGVDPGQIAQSDPGALAYLSQLFGSPETYESARQWADRGGLDPATTAAMQREFFSGDAGRQRGALVFLRDRYLAAASAPPSRHVDGHPVGAAPHVQAFRNRGELVAFQNTPEYREDPAVQEECRRRIRRSKELGITLT